MNRWTGFLFGLIFFSIATVWLRLSIVQTTYQIHQVEREIKNAKKEMEELNLAVTQARSPEHLRRLAENRLNLRPTSQDQIVYLK